jgi:TPR repeat protein
MASTSTELEYALGLADDGHILEAAPVLKRYAYEDPRAAYALANHHIDNMGVGIDALEIDDAKAKELLQFSATRNHDQAQYALARWYLNEKPPDVEEARRWFSTLAGTDSRLASDSRKFLELLLSTSNDEVNEIWARDVVASFTSFKIKEVLINLPRASRRDAARELVTIMEQRSFTAGIDLVELSCVDQIAKFMCTGCGKKTDLKMCNRCGVARYCGSECQRRCWPEHKAHCRQWARQSQ